MCSFIYKKIAVQIDEKRTQIQEPELLPGEVQLAQHYQVSRDTIRRSLKLLEDQGSILRKHGVGTFLQPSKPSPRKLKGTTIGIVPPRWLEESEGWYSSVIYEGIRKWTRMNQCFFSTLHPNTDETNSHLWLENVKSQGVSALLWIHPQTHQLNDLKITSQMLPTVVLGRRLPIYGLHQIIPDYSNAALLVDQHIISKGYPQYAMIGKNVHDPLTKTWIECIGQAYHKRKLKYNPALYNFDYQCFHLSQLPELILDFYLKAHPEINALFFPSSGPLHSLFSNVEFRKAVEGGLAIATTNYGPYPIEQVCPWMTVTHIYSDWSSMAYRAMTLLAQIASGDRVNTVFKEPVRLIKGDTTTKK